MKTVSATDVNHRPGAVIDTAMREGIIGILRRGRLVALLARDPVGVPDTIPWETITAQELLSRLSEILGQTENDNGAYIITRNGREVAWMLPRCMLKNLGLEL